MNATLPLTGSHLRTYQSLFQHPVSHNLGWRAIRAMLEEIADVSEEPNGNLKVTHRGRVLVLHPPRTKDIDDTDELLALRRFLQRASDTAPAIAPPAAQWFVVIDHQEARVYRSTATGSLPQLIRPHVDAATLHQPLHTRDFSRGRDPVSLTRMFEPLAAVLNGAGKILLLGSGTGTSSAMHQFTAWLQLRRPTLAGRIAGTLVVDGHHLSEEQLIALARDFFAQSGTPSP